VRPEYAATVTGRARNLIAAVLLAAMPLAVCAQEPSPSPSPVPKPSEPGSPLAITKIASYTEKTTRNGATMSARNLVCISFENISDRPLKSVTIQLAHQRRDGSVSELKLLQRDGTFSPGVEIRGYQGEKVGRPDSHALSNCPEFSELIPGLTDAAFTSIRPIAAVYEDGTTWVSARPPLALSTTPPVVAETEAPPPWDAAHHTGYIAVVSGGGTLARGAPQLISIFAPGRRTASATLTFPKCCVMAIAFGQSGDLIVGTTGIHAGLQVYAPGSTEPTRSLPDHDGFSIAHDDAGDLAIGGYNSGPDVAVYPRDGAPYRITGQPVPGGLAMSPAGELALIEYKSRMVRIYPRGAVTPAREITFDMASEVHKGVGPVGSVAYDRKGNLAVLDYLGHSVRIFEPGHDQPTVMFRTLGGNAMAFDGSGRLAVISPQVTTLYGANGKVVTVVTHGGGAIAAGGAGNAALSDQYRDEVVALDLDTKRMTIIPIPTRPSSVAISP
jgi:hypothetical protein